MAQPTLLRSTSRSAMGLVSAALEGGAWTAGPGLLAQDDMACARRLAREARAIGGIADGQPSITAIYDAVLSAIARDAARIALRAIASGDLDATRIDVSPITDIDRIDAAARAAA